MFAILIPGSVFYPAAIAIGVVVAYYVALFVKQVVFKKSGGLFTAKF
jgi:hypothetical protein